MVLFVNKKKGGRIAAVIDIGSNMLKMRIAQLRKGEVAPVDRLEYPLRLGHEVFHEGKISFESLRELSNILHGFSKIMSEYGVDQYKVVATTALRDAKNRDYVIDQLKIQNDMTVEILEDDQEKTLIYSEILNSLSTMPDLPAGNSLISFIGAGTIGLTVFDGKNMVFSQNISIGSLKLHDMLSSIAGDTEEFFTFVEEYLDLTVGHIALPHTNSKIPSLILAGNEIEMIAKACGVEPDNGRYLMAAEQVKELYSRICSMTPAKISEKYGISDMNAEILYSALAIYTKLVKLTEAQFIACPKVELWDALLRQMLLPKSRAAYETHVVENALSCARVIARRYRCTPEHADKIWDFACKIFDKTKSLHGMDAKKRLMLELACILHDCGYYINNSKAHLRSTFDLIKNIDIYGLTDEEVMIVAFLCRYDEFTVPSYDDLEFVSLDRKKRLLVSKLSAILRMANALDKSQKQKLDDIKVKLEDDRLIIAAQSAQSAHLEKWAFDLCAPFFQEVFGVSPVLSVKFQII